MTQSKQQSGEPVPRSRGAALLVVGLALVVLGGTLTWSAFDLRAQIRGQIVHRDAEILDAVAVMQHLNDQASDSKLASLTDPGEQFEIALKVSKLRNVLGVRLYSADGGYANSFPAYITEAPLAPSDLRKLQELQPVSHYFARARIQDLDMLADPTEAPEPLLSVEVPLRADHQQKLAGIIQFQMDGSSIARQFAELDHNLIWRFATAFMVGAIVLSLGLGWALQRVHKANQLLAERTRHLLEANRELALAARVSAVGAVTAHLIHGLKNPLSGLANFVSSQRAEGANLKNEEWQAALSTTKRMQEMIDRVVRVLQEQQSGVEYQISAVELAGLLKQKLNAAAAATGVGLEIECAAKEVISNRETDLILLVLENLVQNAIEATPAGRAVRLQVAGRPEELVFEVVDEGGGLPPSVEMNLFKPCTSTKKDGGGIGLAICKQLAQHLEARLELARSSAAGCTFRFAVPLRKTNLASDSGGIVPDSAAQ